MFERRVLLLVINGRGSVKGDVPRYRFSHLYGEGGVNLYWFDNEAI